MRKSLNIAMIGAYGTNVGDNIILLGILKQMDKTLKEKGYDGKFYVFTNYPSYLQRFLKKEINKLHSRVIFLRITDFPKLIFTLAKTDILIWGGGGLITDDWHPIFSNLYLILIILAYCFRKFIVVYSIGASVPTSKIGKFIVRRVLSLPDIITVRDINSKRALLSIGIKKQIQIFPDPGLLLRLFIEISTSKHLENIKTAGNLIGNVIVAVSLRYIFKYHQFNRVNHKYLINELATFFNNIIKSYNATVVFIPFNKHPKKWFENDLIIARRLKHRINNKARFIIIEDVDTLEKLITIIKSSDILIGARLHSLILASVANIPMIGIVGDSKISSFLTMIGFSEFSVDPSDLDLNIKLLKLFEKAVSNKKSYKSFLKRRSNLLAEKASKLPTFILTEYAKRRGEEDD